MHVSALSITRISITCSIIYCAFVSASTLGSPTTQFSNRGKMLKMVDDINDNDTDSRGQSDSTVREETSWDTTTATTTLVSTVCEFLPDACKRMRQIKDHFLLNTGESEARGPKDLIAIISTILASLLGAILVKLNVLIVLSLISVGIGKILLLLLAVKTKIFSTEHTHPHHQPLVYEKVYYPRHHYHDVPNQHEYPSETLQEYSSSMYS